MFGFGRRTPDESLTSNLAKKFEFLQDRAQRKPINDVSMPMPGSDDKKKNINNLKDFYLKRLAKNEPQVAARLAQAGVRSADASQPSATGQHTAARPTFSAGATQDIEELEIMCNNCFNLIKSSEAALCTGDASKCAIALKSGGAAGGGTRASGMIPLLDIKLKKLRSALETRLADSSSKVTVMRHLTQLRYHIDTAAKWTPGCSEIGAVSDHTVQQAKQLTVSSRVIAPAVYIFSKRIENVIVQKERELRRLLVSGGGPSKPGAPAYGGYGLGDLGMMDADRDAASVIDASSVVSDLNSDCGTQYAETMITQDGLNSTQDVGNLSDANEYLSLKSEDEQRRWFYSQCLTVKLACADKERARKTLISDLYARVRSEGIKIEDWSQWIKTQLGG